MLTRIIVTVLLTITTLSLTAQEKECLAFYNLENLFDTKDDTLINDEEYLPKNGWTVERYNEKIDKMAEVISLLGKDGGVNGPALLGVSEIENKDVLVDLIAHPLLKDHHYQILHFNSPDWRGVDVAALYKKDRFTPLSVKSIPVMLYKKDGKRKYTRDILYIKGLLGSDIVHVSINHWPSRWGGQKASGPYREKAAAVNKILYDSLRTTESNVNFIIMGDFNDNPNDKSLSKILKAKKNFPSNNEYLFNPFYSLYSKGIGSNAWNDTWSNFDQIIISSSFSGKDSSWKYDKIQIFKKPFMLRQTGRYKGYPLRTKAGGQYLGGFSDHFPVLIYIHT